MDRHLCGAGPVSAAAAETEVGFLVDFLFVLGRGERAGADNETKGDER